MSCRAGTVPILSFEPFQATLNKLSLSSGRALPRDTEVVGLNSARCWAFPLFYSIQSVVCLISGFSLRCNNTDFILKCLLSCAAWGKGSTTRPKNWTLSVFFLSSLDPIWAFALLVTFRKLRQALKQVRVPSCPSLRAQAFEPKPSSPSLQARALQARAFEPERKPIPALDNCRANKVSDERNQ